MQNIMIQMGKECSFGVKVFDDRQGFFKAKMRRVRFDADAVQHQNVKIAEAVHRSWWNRFEIGRIGKIIEPVRNDWQFSVDYLKRCDLEIFADAERRIF